MLFYGMALILIALVVHLSLWKIDLPKNHTKLLLGIFLVILIIGIFILNKFKNQIALWSIAGPTIPAEYLQLVLLYISLTLAYLTTYSVIEVDSPSFLILIIIDKEGLRGLSLEKFNEIMTDEILVKPRIKDLINGTMIYLDKDKYKLTNKGLWLIRIFVFCRKLLNLGKGG